MINRDGAAPPYLQLANLLEEQIRSGKLAPGARVPSITTLSQDYDVAKNTARRALGVLRERGLVDVTPGWGTFVRPGS
ncbi:MAG TPA: winged helix-turn-helix domain-containing protein [Streptosporangiaceae bacterium]|nr:winged helix-turn-helix domain-containing protein [Streptosporangiaceae bacterium]